MARRGLQRNSVFILRQHIFLLLCRMMLRTNHLQVAQSCDNRISVHSWLTQSIHPHLCLHFLLFSGISNTITILPTYSSSLLITRPFHVDPISCTFFDISSTVVVPLIISWLIGSRFVIPQMSRHYDCVINLVVKRLTDARRNISTSCEMVIYMQNVDVCVSIFTICHHAQHKLQSARTLIARRLD